MTLLTKLFRFQARGVERLEAFHGRALLADDPGLGKSIQMLAYLDQHPEIDRALVVCPAYLKYNWEGEIRKHLGLPCQLLFSKSPPRANARKPTARIFVINYDILYKWVPWLLRLKLGLVMLDEAHLVKHRSAKRTHAAMALCQGDQEHGFPAIPHVICATGTPVEQKPTEVWSLLHILHPDKFPTFQPFARRYTNPYRARWGWVYEGSRNEAELHQRLVDLCMIRRKKEHVLLDLPAKLTTVIPLDIRKPAKYRAAEKDIIAYLSKHDPKRVKGALRAQALAQVSYVKRLAARLKYLNAVAWVDNQLNNGGKLLLFAIHKDMIARLKRRYRGQCVVVTGETPPRLRKLAFDQFNKNRKIRVFIGNIDAAGTGWSAQADAVAFMELSWVPTKHTQAADRAHGLGRGIEGKRTQVFWLVAKDTFEEKLCKLLQTKQETADAIVDGGVATAGLNVFDVLCATLRGNP